MNTRRAPGHLPALLGLPITLVLGSRVPAFTAAPADANTPARISLSFRAVLGGEPRMSVDEPILRS